jgi:hypothetical protein
VLLKLLPTLLPRRARAITEIQRATLHVIAQDLDGKREMHETLSLVCLARTSSYNAVLDPDTGRVLDLRHYYGAWVTPYAEPVQRVIRQAAALRPEGQMWGYQGDRQAVNAQVAALYKALRRAGIRYVNSVIDYGAPPGHATQRTRLPRESLRLKSANCIDAAVLMASLLEGASLNPALVFVPGHAFVAWELSRGGADWERMDWEQADGKVNWDCLETTVLADQDFEVACKLARNQYRQYKGAGASLLKVLPLSELRARGIWPME